MTSRRVAIPKALQNELLYRSARTCCICRIPRQPVEIHHINRDPSHNDEGNLIVICRNCHDEAHTQHAMSKNLTADQLRYAKQEWAAEVAARASEAMLPSSNLRQAMWTFVNHEKIPRLLKERGFEFEPWIFQHLRDRGVIDPNGVPIFQRKASGSWLATIYDRFEWDAAKQIHDMYMHAVDELIRYSSPLELGAIWSKTEFRNLVKPGALCFAMRGFKFKPGERKNREENRLVHARSKGIEIRFHANTRHMYGSSALHTNFCGSSFTAVLLLAKDLVTEGNLLVLNATPIAMGAGFIPSAYYTPHPLRYGWASSGQSDPDVGEDIRDFL